MSESFVVSIQRLHSAMRRARKAHGVRFRGAIQQEAFSYADVAAIVHDETLGLRLFELAHCYLSLLCSVLMWHGVHVPCQWALGAGVTDWAQVLDRAQTASDTLRGFGHAAWAGAPASVLKSMSIVLGLVRHVAEYVHVGKCLKCTEVSLF